MCKFISPFIRFKHKTVSCIKNYMVEKYKKIKQYIEMRNKHVYSSIQNVYIGIPRSSLQDYYLNGNVR